MKRGMLGQRGQSWCLVTNLVVRLLREVEVGARGPALPHVTRCGEEREVTEARACGLGLKEGNYKI